jgi:hypothetical protein
MVKKKVSEHAIPKSITNFLNAYIKNRINCEDLTNLSMQLKAAIEVGDKTKIGIISKKQQELCSLVKQLSKESFKEDLEIQRQLPKDFKLLRGMTLQILQQNACEQVVSNYLLPTDMGYIINNEDVSGESTSDGWSTVWSAGYVSMHDWLRDSTTPDPLPHFGEDSYYVTQVLECTFPAPEVDSLLVWHFDTPFGLSFVQGAASGSVFLGWGAFSFPFGRSFPFGIGPFLSLHSASESCDIDSVDKSMYNTMTVSAGIQARLQLYLTLIVRAYSGRVLADATVDYFDGCGHRGIHYYFLPVL